MSSYVYPVSALRLMIDEKTVGESLVLKGRIAGVAVARTQEFSSSFELLLKMDEVLDEIGKPQSSRKLRSFVKEEPERTFQVNPKRYHPAEEIKNLAGRLLTVDVFFVSRLHSSWQGFLRNTKGERIGDFTSDMEFIEQLEVLLTADDGQPTERNLSDEKAKD